MEGFLDFIKNVNFADETLNNIKQDEDINNFISNTLSENEIDLKRASGVGNISNVQFMAQIYLHILKQNV